MKNVNVQRAVRHLLSDSEKSDSGVDFCFAKRIFMQKSIVTGNEVNSNKKRRTNMKSDNCRVGMAQAPHRSLFNALGFTEEEMKKFIEKHFGNIDRLPIFGRWQKELVQGLKKWEYALCTN